uniref:Polynucleotide adenylyltransferase n=1 Tax=Meloidogyne hapla TaxID=6305 RepID=A0A1I8BCE0_MELHA
MVGNKNEDLEKIAKILCFDFDAADFVIEEIEQNKDDYLEDKSSTSNINNEKEENKIDENITKNNSKKLKNNKKYQKQKKKEINKKSNKKLTKSTNKNYAKLYENNKSKAITFSETKEEENIKENSDSENELFNEENENKNNELSQNSVESDEESQTSVNEKTPLEEECSNTKTSENELLIQNNLIEKPQINSEEEKNIKNQNSDNKINILKKEEGECSSSNNSNQKLEKKKNYWKTIKNNGEITEQKYFDNNDWELYEILSNKSSNQIRKNIASIRDYSTENVIDGLMGIIYLWNSNAKMLISGSYLLNVRTEESDIDIIIIIPSLYEDMRDLENISKEQFYSNFDCDISIRYCDDNSFYCLLCQDYRTNSLRKIPGRVSTINLEFFGQQFDIILVVLPPKIFLELNKVINNNIFGFEKNLSVKIFDKIIANFIESVGGYLTFNEKSEYLGMLLALSDNFIYGNRFGFFSGTSIAVLACHFIMSNPNTTIINLLGKIFEYFSNKQIISYDGNINSLPLILELNINYQQIRQNLDWNIQNEYNNRLKQIPSIFHQNLKINLYPIWPIITPGFPTQNSNFNMNISTAKIIQQTMGFGKIIIIVMRNLFVIESDQLPKLNFA